MPFLQSVGFATPAMAAEAVLALAARVFVFNLVTGCTFLGSLRLAKAARDRARRSAVLALVVTSAVVALFLLDPPLGRALACLFYVVCFVIGLGRLRGLLAERAARWGLQAPTLGRAAFGAGLLVAFDGIFLAQSVTTILVVPVATLIQLVRAAVEGIRGRFRAALEHLGGAVVWAAAGAAVVCFILHNHSLARTRAEDVIAACRRYEADKGRLPSNLEELVPAYLAAIPRAKRTAFNYSFEYSDHRGSTSSRQTAGPPEIRAGADSAAHQEPDVSPAKSRRDAAVLACARARGLEYDRKEPIHSLRYSTDGPFARWVYFFEQDKWVLLK